MNIFFFQENFAIVYSLFSRGIALGIHLTQNQIGILRIFNVLLIRKSGMQTMPHTTNKGPDLRTV